MYLLVGDTRYVRENYKGAGYTNIRLDLQQIVIKLPRIDEIRIRGYRNLERFSKKTINASIESVAGRYYVLLCVEEERLNIKVIHRRIVGMDLEGKDRVITRDGKKYKTMSNMITYERKIKGLNR